MRVVLDANILVSAAISTAGPPREIVNAWTDGRLELIASPKLLARGSRRTRPTEIPALDQHRNRD